MFTLIFSFLLLMYFFIHLHPNRAPHPSSSPSPILANTFPDYPSHSPHKSILIFSNQQYSIFSGWCHCLWIILTVDLKCQILHLKKLKVTATSKHRSVKDHKIPVLFYKHINSMYKYDLVSNTMGIMMAQWTSIEPTEIKYQPLCLGDPKFTPTVSNLALFKIQNPHSLTCASHIAL